MNSWLIKNCTIVTLDENDTIIEKAHCRIVGNRIDFVGTGDEFEGNADKNPKDVIVDGSGKVLMPALYNGHCHSPMTFERGWAEDLPLDRWFNERIWVAESALTEDDVFWGAQLAACEMIRAGVVGFNDHYFYMDKVADTVRQSGMRAALAWCVFGIGDDKEVGANLEGTLKFLERCTENSNGRVKPVLGPHSPYVCPGDFLKEVAKIAKERSLPLHIHACESQGQIDQAKELFGKTPIGFFQEVGFFHVPVTIAHGLYIADEDIEILAANSASVVRCPITYMKLAMGTSDVRRLTEKGVNVALGSDGPGSNNDMDLFNAMRALALLQKHETGDATAVTSAEVLKMATQNGARVCGFPEAGKIKKGALADCILVDFEKPHLQPVHDVLANLVHCAHSGDVTDVMCDGQWLLRDSKLQTLDEKRILNEANRRAKEMVSKPLEIMREYKE